MSRRTHPAVITVPTLGLAFVAFVAFVALGALGCGPGPYAKVADAYGAATEASAAALATAPATAARVCRKRAHAAYLQTRLGLLAAPPQPIPWSRWYAEARATEKQSWSKYCGDVAAAGKLLTLATTAIKQYGAALKALAAGEAYDGAEFQKAVESSSQIADALESPAASAAAKPVGNLLGKLAAFLVRDVTEDKLEDYVREADPVLAPLLEAIERYVAAVEDELKIAENTDRQTLLALEAKSGLSGQEVDPVKLIAFYGFAVVIEEELASRREALAGYKAVLQKLRAAHEKLARAGTAKDELEIKQALGAVFEILTQVQALSAALSKE